MLNVFSYLLIVLAIAFPHYYLLIIFGQLIHGVTNAIQWSIPPLFAVLWFPNHEVAIAIAANFIGAAFGAAIGFAVPPLVLTEPPGILYPEIYFNLTEDQMQIPILALKYWKTEDRFLLLTLFGGLLGLTALLLLFFCKFLTDLPAKPPTLAQTLRRQSTPEDFKTFNKENLQEYFALLKALFTDKTVVLLLLVYSIVHRAVELEITLMGELIRAVFASFNIAAPPNIITSYIMVLLPILGVFGSYISGKLLDKFKKFRKQTIVGAGMTFLSTVGIALSYYFENFPGLCVFNGGLGFSMQICIISLLAVVTRHSYPINEAFVSIWIAGFESFVLIVIAELGRLFIDKINNMSVFILMSALLFMSFVLAIITKPQDRRLDAEREVLQNAPPTSRNPT